MLYIYPHLSLVSYSFGWKLRPVELRPTKTTFLPSVYAQVYAVVISGDWSA